VATGPRCAHYNSITHAYRARAERRFRTGVDIGVKLPAEIHLHAPGMRSAVKTVEQAHAMIDHEPLPETARLSRWTFARALLLEAQKTGKTHDLNAAFRQLKQASNNEKWLANE
jgi:hypothetical protein